MTTAVEIAIEHAAPSFDKLYTYVVPQSLKEKALPGARVRVSFGRGKAKRNGMIMGEVPLPDSDKLKPILQVLDDPPLLGEEGLGLVRHLKETTFCTWYDAIRLLIPAGLDIQPRLLYQLGENSPAPQTPLQEDILEYLRQRGRAIQADTFYESTETHVQHPDLQHLLATQQVECIQELRQRVLDDKVTMVALVDGTDPHLTPRQTEVMDFLLAEAPVSLREATYYTGASRSVFDVLERKGAIEYYEQIRFRGGFDQAEQENLPPPSLSPDQEKVYHQLVAHQKEPHCPPALLYGVTGSGKTQVFLQLVQDAVDQGKSAIVMVPEISLTSQTVRALQSRFGNQVAVLHSGLSLGERMDEWTRINEGKAPVVVGTRSAVFAPVDNLGIIVIDEEQEHTYKSDRSPRYHTRDVAYLRSRYHDALLLLCSATPAVESYHFATQDRYKLYTLPQRFGDAILPDVFLIDMRESHNLSDSTALSQVLLEEIYYNLEHDEQSILLLNRRGYSTLVKCSSCGAPAECPHCSVTMTYHTVNDSLLCHYCGHSQPRHAQCTTCGSEFIRYAGIGTQRLEQELQGFFPQARILRMDTDTTLRRDSHERMFDDFRKEEYDILIGTQMVAKGLNFPNVTLVGVISADQALFADDFRSYERSFSLLTQVVGRSGRGDRAGRAFIQTYTPDHPIIELASQQDYPGFFSAEIASRRLHLYPPFCTLAGFGFVGENHEEVQQAAWAFARHFNKNAKKHYAHLPLRVMGPSQGDVLKVAGKYRYKLVVKCRNDRETRQFFALMLDWFYKQYRNVSIFIDMYYERM